jgi:hypothetical protein
MVRATRSSSISLLFALFALLLGGLARTGQAQNNWSRYTPGTMDAVIQQHDSSIRADHAGKKGPALVVSGDDFPTVARVTYRGESRPLDSNRREVLREWSLAFLRDTSAVTDFHREYLFQEGKRAMWLPVQDTVASYLGRELRPGQPVTLYVIWAGAHYAGKDITWTFLVNEFKAESAGK